MPVKKQKKRLKRNSKEYKSLIYPLTILPEPEWQKEGDDFVIFSLYKDTNFAYTSFNSTYLLAENSPNKNAQLERSS